MAPRLGEYKGDEKPEEIRPATPQERKGLWCAGVAGLLFAGWILWGLLPAQGFLRDPGTFSILRSPSC